VSQSGPEAGAPDDCVRIDLAAISPLNTGSREPVEHRLGAKEPGVAGCADGRDCHDVAEQGRPSGVAVSGVEGASAGRGDVEQGAAVDVVGKEARRPPRHPSHLDAAVQGEIGGDVRRSYPRRPP
jgi:hypothetical protein